LKNDPLELLVAIGNQFTIELNKDTPEMIFGMFMKTIIKSQMKKYVFLEVNSWKKSKLKIIGNLNDYVFNEIQFKGCDVSKVQDVNMYFRKGFRLVF
jgi:hypothetical protein